jgi:hypothetical protein
MNDSPTALSVEGSVPLTIVVIDGLVRVIDVEILGNRKTHREAHRGISPRFSRFAHHVALAFVQLRASSRVKRRQATKIDKLPAY